VFVSCRLTASHSGHGSAAPDRSVDPVKAQNGCGAVLLSRTCRRHSDAVAFTPLLSISMVIVVRLELVGAQLTCPPQWTLIGLRYGAPLSCCRCRRSTPAPR
jgi:hypothetical protein